MSNENRDCITGQPIFRNAVEAGIYIYHLGSHSAYLPSPSSVGGVRTPPTDPREIVRLVRVMQSRGFTNLISDRDKALVAIADELAAQLTERGL